MMNTFSKVVGHKINLQRSVAFVYTNNKYAEIRIMEILPFTVANKSNKVSRTKYKKGDEKPIQ